MTGKQVAFFISSTTAVTPATYLDAKAKFVEGALSKFAKINAVSTEAFGGRMRLMGKTVQDNTDLAKVEAWAETLEKKFIQ